VAPGYTNRIHRDDAAAALGHLAALPQAERTVIGVDSEPALACEVISWLARRLELPVPPPAQGATPGARAARGSKRCRNARLLATGFRFRYPTYREGYGALLAEHCA
jgi:nucleoside-diphosphate-sugar epimerase